MHRRATQIGRSIAGALLLGLSPSACFDDVRPAWALAEDPVVVGISLAVVEDGPYAVNLAPVPPDRPRAEVLPLDVVELDALVVDVDGPWPLDEAAWVLCGVGCLASLERQGQQFGELPDCHEGSVDEAHACLAGRGPRPHVVIPDVVPLHQLPPFFTWWAYPRVLVVSGRADGPTTDACLEQLVFGPRIDLTGCAIGTSDLVYGPLWVIGDVLTAAGEVGWDDVEWPPSEVLEVLPPNTAAVIEQVRVADITSPEMYFAYPEEEYPDALLPLYSIDEVIEVPADTDMLVVPEVSLRDQQIVLSSRGTNAWLGRFEDHFYQEWSDDPEIDLQGWPYGYIDRFVLHTPKDERTFHLYVKVLDRPGSAVSWFTLTLRVVDR